jgi:hypothetical protein
MNPQPSFDTSIPVLTEVFQDRPARLEPEGLAPGLAPALAADLANEPAPHEVKPEATDPEMEALEQRLCERILQQLQGRVDLVLEQRLRESMEQALHHAMAGLTDEIGRGLQQAIEKIVVAAVAQELTHLRALKT